MQEDIISFWRTDEAKKFVGVFFVPQTLNIHITRNVAMNLPSGLNLLFRCSKCRKMTPARKMAELNWFLYSGYIIWTMAEWKTRKIYRRILSACSAIWFDIVSVVYARLFFVQAKLQLQFCIKWHSHNYIGRISFAFKLRCASDTPSIVQM